MIAQQQAEIESLTASQGFFRTIVASEPACVKLVERDGTILSMNPAGLAMVEVQRESEVVGLSVYDVLRREDHEAFRAGLVENFEGRKTHLEFEITGMKGTRRRMETFSAPLRDAYGDVCAALAITHDITARTRDQRELHRHREHLEDLVEKRTRELEQSRLTAQRAERLASLGTLAAGLAHEINNPLGAIRMAAELALQTEEPAPTTRALEDIRAEVKRCSRIVNSVLEFGRDEPSKKQPLSLNQIVESVGDRTRRTRKSIHLTLDLEEELPLISGNETELERVIVNILQNAIQASLPGEPILIRTQTTGAHVVCEIRDRGAGMTAENAERAFDPFYSTRMASGGTGLGLSVSHGIVREHGGTIELDSRPGHGTSVALTFPTPEA